MGAPRGNATPRKTSATQRQRSGARPAKFAGMITTDATSTLKENWAKFRESHPKIRIRDAAAVLGVSEAELLATACGETVTRLEAPAEQPGWGAVIRKFPALGRVMALTRNEHCVHERRGEFREIGFFGSIGNVQGPDIDLRLFLNHWHFGFAVREQTGGELRRSMQFFDKHGTAVHKVYLERGGNAVAFDAIEAEFRSADQAGAIAPESAPEPFPEKPDAGIDTEGFRTGWRGLKDTHEFYILLKRFGVTRTQALRLIGEEFAMPLKPLCAEALLTRAAAAKLPIMVFVGNAGAIQIHTGTVEHIVPFGEKDEWINVLDDEFNLHLRQTAIRQAWLVQKPTADGYVTSVELFDDGGELVAQFFGKRKPGEPELEEWRRLAGGLL